MTISVSRAEANVLTLARVALGLVPAQDALRLLVTSLAPPAKLGPTARAALADTLSRGVVLALARQGGWLGLDATRLWDRTAAPPLAFTGNVVRLLTWLLQTPLAEADVPPLVFEGALTPAEQVVVALLVDRLRGTGCDHAVVRQVALRDAPLVVLAHAASLARTLPLDAPVRFDVAALGPFVEGLRLLLARSWVAEERTKRVLVAPEELLRGGRAQASVLEAFLRDLDAAGRRDLATFLVDVAVTAVPELPSGEALTQGMKLDAPLRERTEARRAAGAFLRSLATLRTWDQAHRGVRFIDDGYELAQKLVKDWERFGDAGFTRAAALVGELDAIPTLKPVEASAPRP